MLFMHGDPLFAETINDVGWILVFKAIPYFKLETREGMTPGFSFEVQILIFSDRHDYKRSPREAK